MNTIYIFTDASTSPQKGIAVGAFLCLNQQTMDEYALLSREALFALVSSCIHYKEYQSKKSTWSEIKTVIHALNAIQQNEKIYSKIEIYTDCQSLCDLLGRRKEKLLSHNFLTKTGKILPNADLYKELFAEAEQYHIQTFKIKGHHSIAKRITLQEKIFSVIDVLSRQKLRLIQSDALLSVVMPARS